MIKKLIITLAALLCMWYAKIFLTYIDKLVAHLGNLIR
jgi:hypothetical protein